METFFPVIFALFCIVFSFVSFYLLLMRFGKFFESPKESHTIQGFLRAFCVWEDFFDSYKFIFNYLKLVWNNSCMYKEAEKSLKLKIKNLCKEHKSSLNLTNNENIVYNQIFAEK